jgi:hypothetical protein
VMVKGPGGVSAEQLINFYREHCGSQLLANQEECVWTLPVPGGHRNCQHTLRERERGIGHHTS